MVTRWSSVPLKDALCSIFPLKLSCALLFPGKNTQSRKLEKHCHVSFHQDSESSGSHMKFNLEENKNLSNAFYVWGVRKSERAHFFLSRHHLCVVNIISEEKSGQSHKAFPQSKFFSVAGGLTTLFPAL